MAAQEKSQRQIVVPSSLASPQAKEEYRVPRSSVAHDQQKNRGRTDTQALHQENGSGGNHREPSPQGSPAKDQPWRGCGSTSGLFAQRWSGTLPGREVGRGKLDAGTTLSRLPSQGLDR